MAVVRDFVRDFVRNWIPISVFALICFFSALHGVRFASEYIKHYNYKVSDKGDAVLRLRHMCYDAETVHKTNYGEKCRRYEHDAKIVPWWDALVAVADSYRLCDARTGCGGGVLILAMVVPVLGLLLYLLYRAHTRYPAHIRRFNDEEDANFLHNVPSVYTHPCYHGAPTYPPPYSSISKQD